MADTKEETFKELDERFDALVAEKVMKHIRPAYNQAAIDGIEAVRDVIKLAPGFVSTVTIESILDQVQEEFRKDGVWSK